MDMDKAAAWGAGGGGGTVAKGGLTEGVATASNASSSSYLAVRGSDLLLQGSLAFGGRDRSWSTFYGTCFNCQYKSHSQKFCPLRRCGACKQYGHADAWCPQTRSFSAAARLPSAAPYSPSAAAAAAAQEDRAHRTAEAPAGWWRK